jgi:hypothetical protein
MKSILVLVALLGLTAVAQEVPQVAVKAELVSCDFISTWKVTDKDGNTVAEMIDEKYASRSLRRVWSQGPLQFKTSEFTHYGDDGKVSHVGWNFSKVTTEIKGDLEIRTTESQGVSRSGNSEVVEKLSESKSTNVSTYKIEGNKAKLMHSVTDGQDDGMAYEVIETQVSPSEQVVTSRLIQPLTVSGEDGSTQLTSKENMTCSVRPISL